MWGSRTWSRGECSLTRGVGPTTDWIDRHDDIDEGDSPFAFHDDYAVPTGGPTDADSTESELYGPIDDEVCRPSTRRSGGASAGRGRLCVDTSGLFSYFHPADETLAPGRGSTKPK